MAKIFSFTQDGIEYNNVTRYGSTFNKQPFGVKGNYTTSGNNIVGIKSQKVFNIIDVSWNGALLPDADGNYTIRINTTSDLLLYIKQLVDDYQTLAQ